MKNGTLSNKDKAVDFLQLVVSGDVRTAFERHIAPNFCHHNPYVRGDADSLMLAMEEDAANNPDKTFEIKLAIGESNNIMVHSHVKQNNDDLGWAIVHIFRFDNDRIVELWDLVQQVPGNSENENGIF